MEIPPIKAIPSIRKKTGMFVIYIRFYTEICINELSCGLFKEVTDFVDRLFQYISPSIDFEIIGNLCIISVCDIEIALIWLNFPHHFLIK